MDADTNHGPYNDGKLPSTTAASDKQQDNAPMLRKRLLAARAALTVTQRQQAAAKIMQHLEDGWQDSPAGKLLIRLQGDLKPVDDDQPVLPARRKPIIAAFWPIRDEPNLLPLLQRWAHDKYLVALPCTAVPAAPLVFKPWTPDARMRKGAFGIPEPDTSTVCIPDVILVPTLGYTDAAERLGYGGGYYDRTLAALQHDGREHVAIGIAYSVGRMTPHEHTAADHDITLDAVVTDAGWVVP